MEMDIVIAVANVKELEERTLIINKLRDEVDNFFKNGWNETKRNCSLHNRVDHCKYRDFSLDNAYGKVRGYTFFA